MAKENKVRIIASGLYLENALKTYENRNDLDHVYDTDFEIHVAGYVLTVIDGQISIQPTSDIEKKALKKDKHE